MTLTYEILKRLVKLIGLKKQSAKDVDQILAIKRRQNARTRIPEIRDPEITGDIVEAAGFPLLRLRHTPKADGANLFIIGGGMVSPPRPGSIKKAVRVAKETGLDLFVPYYPLCTEYPLTKAYEMIFAAYQIMLLDYPAEKISLLGTSSGGNLALGMPAYMNAIRSDLKRPAQILAISPGTCPVTEAERARMAALDALDVAISAKYMDSAETIMRCGDDSVPDYMIHLQTADFTNCPKVTFIYGSDETLYAFAPSFEAAMKRCGVPCRMIVGEGMFHCYPVFPICREAKEGWNLMIRILKGGEG